MRASTLAPANTTIAFVRGEMKKQLLEREKNADEKLEKARDVIMYVNSRNGLILDQCTALLKRFAHDRHHCLYGRSILSLQSSLSILSSSSPRMFNYGQTSTAMIAKLKPQLANAWPQAKLQIAHFILLS
jgi:hypothetical protein